MVITQVEYDKTKKKKIKIESNQIMVPQNNSEIMVPYGFVPSSSTPGVYYLLSGHEDDLKCSCPARVVCKHLKDGKSSCLRISGSVQKEV